jgi:hypothetical protein
LAGAATDAHRPGPQRRRRIHLIFNGDQRGDVLDVLYRYNKRGALMATVILQIPKDWTIAFRPREANVNQFLSLEDRRRGTVLSNSTRKIHSTPALSGPQLNKLIVYARMARCRQT